MSFTNSLVFAIAGSVAVQHMTVMEGETLTIKCRIRNAHRSHVEWKNPNGHVMFFNDHKGEDIIIPYIDRCSFYFIYRNEAVSPFECRLEAH